ncbi:MAG: acetyl-CoA carboxylase, carboxyltransferase subunit beta [Bacteroidetes bacterium]|nr:acetyl-CoA carboxylase, carboxyltransferase subunit beta [Bacteroidota bacterium]
MAWFKRSKENISIESQKRDTPEGLWKKCPACGEILHIQTLKENLSVCSKCNYHFRIGSEEYFSFLLDDKSFKEYDAKMISKDFLNFVDTKKYKDRIREAIKSTGLKDAIRYGTATINKIPVSIACMDFEFIGGSIGSVVGEKIARAADLALNKKIPLIIISSSGGARMMEAAYSLMQLAKTSSRLNRLAKAKVPYISILTDPTTGGASASFSMLGDIHIAEPGALIGFAGPRVIKQTIKKELPEGFQKAETVLEKGFIDLVVHRKEIRQTLTRLLNFIK